MVALVKHRVAGTQQPGHPVQVSNYRAFCRGVVSNSTNIFPNKHSLKGTL